jgi:hypothetical protein
VLAFRLEVLQTVLAAGDAIEKIDRYRPLFERCGYSLTAASHMRQLVPVLAKKLLDEDKVAVESKLVSVIFDGTSHFGELEIVIIRYWDGDIFRQRLIRLRHSDHPLDRNTLALLLDRAILKLGVDPKNVVAFIKDTASVNFAAVGKLHDEVSYENALNMPCFSHIINRIGAKIKLELARSFISAWSSYFSKSIKGKTEWANFQTENGIRNKLPNTRSVIRWYNDHEICCEILDVFGFTKVRDFCIRHRQIAVADDDEDDQFRAELLKLDAKLRDFFVDQDKIFKLEVELMLMKHYGRPLAQACYHLEGDDALLPYVESHFNVIRSKFNPRMHNLLILQIM